MQTKRKCSWLFGDAVATDVLIFYEIDLDKTG